MGVIKSFRLIGNVDKFKELDTNFKQYLFNILSIEARKIMQVNLIKIYKTELNLRN